VRVRTADARTLERMRFVAHLPRGSKAPIVVGGIPWFVLLAGLAVSLLLRASMTEVEAISPRVFCQVASISVSLLLGVIGMFVIGVWAWIRGRTQSLVLGGLSCAACVFVALIVSKLLR